MSSLPQSSPLDYERITAKRHLPYVENLLSKESAKRLKKSTAAMGVMLNRRQGLLEEEGK